ncbi:GNAT family N-acetyltransferase [Arthrobacter oryzae]|uniref:RimJ/RimL family protein N-acetyltransferase n=1 Tax=Arthrobacter oryzae TaxID=409290 RepID=A0A495FP81_9MICC|nr:GNAT family N-acetyltransferase [Arthrobacter oryzae]RKR30166.1 RimJ/RimL family protein N-acetyltransferase [Arthrobacter oryzae]
MLLRPTSAADINVFLGWVHDEEAMVMWTGPTFSWPLTRFQLELYLTNSLRQYWTGIDGTTGAVLGHGTLLFDDEARVCRLGSIIVDPDRRGEGLGRKLVELLRAKAFGTPTVTELTLGVIAQNNPARSLYESLGFRGTEVVRLTPMRDQMWEVISMRQCRENQA